MAGWKKQMMGVEPEHMLVKMPEKWEVSALRVAFRVAYLKGGATCRIVTYGIIALFGAKARRRSNKLFCHLFKALIDQLVLLYRLIGQSSAIDFLHGLIGGPAAAFHDIGIRHTQSVHDRGSVVPEIVIPEVRDVHVIENFGEAAGNHVRVHIKDAFVSGFAFCPGTQLLHDKLWIDDCAVSGIILRIFLKIHSLFLFFT